MMSIVEVPINDLRPAEYNPRKMSQKQADDLKKSIQEFGFVDPIIVNSNPERYNVVIGGHQRLKIASMLGFLTVPVCYVDLSQEKEIELNLRLNQNGGEWDWEKMGDTPLFTTPLLEKIGFSIEELENLGNGEGVGKGSDSEESDGDIDHLETPNTCPGDIYQLGSCRLMCGNPEDVADVQKLIQSNDADIASIDIKKMKLKNSTKIFYFFMEKDPCECDAIIKKYEQLTGNKSDKIG